MTVAVSAWLGVAFLVLSVLATFTMYRFWGYAYDKETRTSACPQWKMNIHRAIGLAYVLLYVAFMFEMVPRLWAYQVEFPARTVVHLCLGISIGVILLVKISILRWFRHFEEWMPVLGTLLMLCSFLLVGLSVPYVLKERALAAGAAGGSAFSAESRARVAALLPEAGFPDEVDTEALTSERALREGRRVLLHKCVHCHDLKTAIASPRTPSAWLRTVTRMADKPSLGPPIVEREQHLVTAYLVAITPDLQRSEKDRREDSLAREQARKLAHEALPRHGPERPRGDAPEPVTEDEREPGEADAAPAAAGDEAKAGARRERRRRRAEPEPRAAEVADAGAPSSEAAADAAPAEPDPEEEAREARAAEAEAVFERRCSLCHELDDVHAAPPQSAGEARELIHRMVDHGLSASERELRLIEEHLVRLFVD